MHCDQKSVYSHFCVGVIGAYAGFLIGKATTPAVKTITKIVVTAIEKEFVVTELAKVSLFGRVIGIALTTLAILATIWLIFLRNHPALDLRNQSVQQQNPPVQQQGNLYYQQPQNQFPHA